MIPWHSTIALFIGLVSFEPSTLPFLESSEAPSTKPVTCSTLAEQVSISDLIDKSQDYHEALVTVRGLIIQPELHLDETQLYLDFVFRLKQDTEDIVVYGRHHRSLGQPAIRMNQSVEVVGTFFKEQNRSGVIIINSLKAVSVRPYPSSIPENT